MDKKVHREFDGFHKVVFLDFDGPMIPLRAMCLEGQTSDPPSVFDPCAVALLNRLCDKTKSKIVVHSHWRYSPVHKEKYPDIKAHLISQGVKEEHLHEDLLCEEIDWRWVDIKAWLAKHPEVNNYVIIEDTYIPVGFEKFEPHMIKVDFSEGFSWRNYEKALERFGRTEKIYY